MRDANTRVWEASTTFHIQPRIMEKGTDINYQDDLGAWQKTDTALTASHAPGAVLEAVRQRSKLHFSPIGEELFNVSYMIDGQAIRTGVRALALLNPVTGQRHVIGVAQASTPVADGNRAVYKNVFPGADVEYVNNNVTFEQNLILRPDFTMPDPASYGMIPASAMLVIVTQIDVSQTNHAMVAKTREGDVDMRLAALADASQLEFRDGDGKPVHRFELGKAWSGATDAVGAGIPVWKRVQWTAGKLFLLEGLDFACLGELPRPIVIDYAQQVATSGKNEEWDRDNTYWITAPYYVNNCTLVIDPSVVVKLGTGANGNNNEGIVINDSGTVKAVGEPYLPVFFTAYSDDGYGFDTDTGGNETTPSMGSGNYRAAFYFNRCEANDSEIRYCRFRFATDAIVNERSELLHPVRDNIFNNCQTSIKLISWANASSYGVDPDMDLINNLMYAGTYGVVLSSSASGYVDWYLDMAQNTIEDMDYAFQLGVSYGCLVNLHMAARNNILANCVYAWDDPLSSLSAYSYYTYTSIDYTGYAQVDNIATGYFQNVANMDQNSPQPEETSQFATGVENSANGKHYLNQQGAFVNAGNGDYGVSDMTTIPPVPKTCASPYSAETGGNGWSAHSTDTGNPDLGYHHPRVDYIVGVNPTKGSAEATVYTGNLETFAGVVVAFFRPNFGSGQNDPYFTHMEFAKNEGQSINAKLKCNAIPNGPTARYGPSTSYPMVRFDSSYYLGTNFVDNRWVGQAGDGVNVGPFTEAGGIVHYGDYPQIKATLFRHLHRALSFEDCHMRYATYNEQLVGLTFERGDVGIFTKDILYTGSSDPDVLLGNVHTMYDAFLNMSNNAIWVKSTDQVPDAYIVTAHEHTFLNCGTAVYMDCELPGTEHSGEFQFFTQMWSGGNCVVGCGAGFTGDTGGDHTPYQHVYPFIDPIDGGNGFNTDAYWNNTEDINHSNVQTWDYYQETPTPVPTLSPRRVNPLLVTLPSAEEAKEWHSMYLAQNSGDASRLPMRIHELDANDPFPDADGWSTGDYDIFIYPVASVGSWSSGQNVKAYTRIVDGGVDDQYTSVSGAELGEGDLLLRVVCYMVSSGGSGPCYLDLKLENESVLRMYLDGSIIRNMDPDDSICVWVGLDGSTYYARATHAPVPYNSTEAVTQNARYGMWHDDGSLFQSAYDGRPGDAQAKRSPAIDITSIDPEVDTTNGTTSTAIPYELDQNTDENDNFRIDAGFHYWGWNFKFQRVGLFYGTTSITYADAYPTPADGTDWETVVYQGGPVTHTFTVKNTGGATLTLGTLTVPEGFTVTQGLSANSLAGGQTATFSVTVDGETEGTYGGNITLSSNDLYKDPFYFAVAAYVGI